MVIGCLRFLIKLHAWQSKQVNLFRILCLLTCFFLKMSTENVQPKKEGEIAPWAMTNVHSGALISVFLSWFWWWRLQWSFENTIIVYGLSQPLLHTVLPVYPPTDQAAFTPYLTTLFWTCFDVDCCLHGMCFCGCGYPLLMRTCDRFEATMVGKKKMTEHICTYTTYLHLYIM